MRYAFLKNPILIVLIALFPGCTEVENTGAASSILDYDWQDNSTILIENGYYHSPNTLDTLQNILTGDTLLPITTLSDSKIIVQKFIPKRMDLQITDSTTSMVILETEFIQDTLALQIYNLENQVFLTLYSPRTGIQILKTNEPINMALVRLSNQQPDIYIDKLKIGDRIDPEKITVVSEEQFGQVNTKYAILISDDNLYLRLKQGYIIDQIEKTNIADEEAKKLISKLSSQFGLNPEINTVINENDFPPSETTTYYWNKNEVSVSLLFTKIIPWNENEEPTETWSIIYSNHIISNILETLYDPEKSEV